MKNRLRRRKDLVLLARLAKKRRHLAAWRAYAATYAKIMKHDTAIFHALMSYLEEEDGQQDSRRS
jgi:glutamate synthase domain-containing protein 3